MNTRGIRRFQNAILFNRGESEREIEYAISRALNNEDLAVGVRLRNKRIILHWLQGRFKTEIVKRNSLPGRMLIKDGVVWSLTNRGPVVTPPWGRP